MHIYTYIFINIHSLIYACIYIKEHAELENVCLCAPVVFVHLSVNLLSVCRSKGKEVLLTPCTDMWLKTATADPSFFPE